MDDNDEDYEQRDQKSNKRKRSDKKKKDKPTKHRKTEEPPAWFKQFVEEQADVSSTSESESESDNGYVRDARRSERVTAMRNAGKLTVDYNDDSGEDSNDSGDEDFMNYFEEDTTQLRDTVTKHVLNNFTQDQREALRNKVEKGVEKAFDVCKELVDETMNPLFGLRPAPNLWKLGMGPNEIKKYTPMLKELRSTDGTNQKVTIQRVLEAHLDQEQKRKLLNLFDVLQTLEPFSADYLTLSSQINAIIDASHNSKFTPEQIDQFSQKEAELKKIICSELPLRLRILNAEMDDQRKAAIYEKYLLLQKTPDDSVTSASLEEWIEEALKTPYTKVQPDLFDAENPGECLVRLKRGFQERLSDMDSVLEPLLSVFNNRIHNPEGGSLVIGLLGAPGVGKSEIGKVIAKVWGIPLQQISLGGILDPSILDGQHPGWVGSNPGRFAKALQEMGVINGVLFLDEIDKLGDTPNGLQVQYSLLHSTDPIQNDKVNDHYLGSKLPLDLSKCLIICALNKTEGMEPALLSRMHIIKVPDYTNTQKTNIMINHLFPGALQNAGLNSSDIVLPRETCSTIQSVVEQHVGKEGGVRGIKSCIRMVVDKLSLLLHTSEEEKTRLNLSFSVNVNHRPVQLTPDVINELYKPGDLNRGWSTMYA